MTRNVGEKNRPKALYRVLFLCTGNSARSLLAESLLNRHGSGRFEAYSAGSHPTGAPHPLTLQLLASKGYRTRALRSKSWDEFVRPESPHFNFVITVCDRAKGETCPVWPGHPAVAHWSLEDPAMGAASDADQRDRFQRTYIEIEDRILRMVAVKISDPKDPSWGETLTAIGEVRTP